MADEKKYRTTAKRLFTRSKNGLQNALRMNDDAEIIESRFAELTKRFGDVLEKHEQYVYELEKGNTTVEEDGWVEEIVTGYDDLERECCRYIKEQRGKEAKVESHSLVSSGEVLDFEKQRTKQVRELEKSNLMK